MSVEYQNTHDWTWSVVFTDGGTLDEYVDGVHTHAYRHVKEQIDAGRQVRFMILTPAADRPELARAIVELEPGQVPIFFRRARIPIPIEDGEGPPDEPYTAHCLGVRRPGQGKRGTSYLFIRSNGNMLLTTKLNAF